MTSIPSEVETLLQELSPLVRQSLAWELHVARARSRFGNFPPIWIDPPWKGWKIDARELGGVARSLLGIAPELQPAPVRAVAKRLRSRIRHVGCADWELSLLGAGKRVTVDWLVGNVSGNDPDRIALRALYAVRRRIWTLRHTSRILGTLSFHVKGNFAAILTA